MRCHTIFNVFTDRFYNHYGIIHNYRDGQNNCKQGNQINTKSHDRHGCKCTDNRHRHSCHRNEHGAEILQKKHNDNQHQESGFNQCLVDFFNRRIDKHRRIKGYVISHILRKILGQFFHLGFNCCGYIQCICFRQLKYSYAGCRFTVKTQCLRIGLRTQLNPTDIFDTRYRAPCF